MLMMKKLQELCRKLPSWSWLILFFAVAYLLPLNGRPMLRPDEFRYAEIPREMAESGDWIVPRAAGMPYFEKPALGYQIIALSFRCFGENAFALRLPGALAAGIAALFLALALKRAFPDEPEMPVLGAAIFLSFAYVWGIGTFAVLDMPLTAALTAAVTALFCAVKSEKRSWVTGWLLWAGAAAGIAFLLKGLLGIAIPALVMGAWLIWRRQWKKLFLYPWPVLLAAVIVALPWSLAIARQESDFWRYFLYEEHWMRFTGRTYDRKPQPFWYFFPILLAGVLPAGLLALAGRWKRSMLRHEGWLFLIFWAGLPFLFFSVSSCKLGTYILPCFPPLAGILAWTLCRAYREDREKFSRRSARIAAAVGIFLLLFAFVVLAAVLLSPFLPRWYAGIPFFPLLTALASGGGGVFLLIKRRASLFLPGAGALALLGVILCCGSFAVPDILLRSLATEKRMEECRAAMPELSGIQCFADKSMMIPVTWAEKRCDVTIVGRPGEFRYALEHRPEYACRQISEEDFGELLRRDPETPRAVWLLRKKKKGLPAAWPAPAKAAHSGDVWLLLYGKLPQAR